jgi:hypothetical protein
MLDVLWLWLCEVLRLAGVVTLRLILWANP